MIKRIQGFVLIVTSVLAFCLAGCTEFNPVTQREDLIMYSTEHEVAIGKNVARQVEKEYKLEKNPLVIERVNAIANKIIPVIDRRDIDYFVRVILAKPEEKEQGADINAFSLPGGYIFIYDGLINFVDNDDQLAGVIAHELGHIVAKHSIKKLQAGMGYTLLSIAGIATGDAQFAGGLNFALANVILSYSREDEFLADQLAVKYLQKAGYDPKAMSVFLEKLRQKQKKDPLHAKMIFRTHPYFSEREVAIKKELGEPLGIADLVNSINNN